MSSAPQNQAYGSAAPVPAGMPPGVKYLGTIQKDGKLIDQYMIPGEAKEVSEQVPVAGVQTVYDTQVIYEEKEIKTHTLQRPKTVMEDREITVQEPKTVIETQSVQVPVTSYSMPTTYGMPTIGAPIMGSPFTSGSISMNAAPAAAPADSCLAYQQSADDAISA